MKKLLIVIGISCLFLSCKNKGSKEILAELEKEYADSINSLFMEDSIYYSGFDTILVSSEALFNTIEYETPLHRVKKERKDLINEMATAEEVTRRLSWAMGDRGGVLTIRIYATTYSGANTGNYRIVIEDAKGKEVYREDLKSSEASVWDASSYGKKYWNLTSVHLKNRILLPFKVHLIDMMRSTREEFIINRTL